MSPASGIPVNRRNPIRALTDTHAGDRRPVMYQPKPIYSEGSVTNSVVKPDEAWLGKVKAVVGVLVQGV